MNMNRQELYNICQNNKIITVEKLFQYLDFQEYAELVYKKDKELADGILMFRYTDRAESLDNYKASLYNEMLVKGRKLNKQNCMNCSDNWTFDYQRSELWNKNK